jgi:hypothetical protein
MSVGQHDRSTFQGGSDDLLDVICAVRGEQQRLRARTHWTMVTRVKQDLAQPDPEVRRTGLASGHDRVAAPA